MMNHHFPISKLFFVLDGANLDEQMRYVHIFSFRKMTSKGSQPNDPHFGQWIQRIFFVNSQRSKASCELCGKLFFAIRHLEEFLEDPSLYCVVTLLKEFIQPMILRKSMFLIFGCGRSS